MKSTKMIFQTKKRNRGSALAEFGPAMLCAIVLILIPLANIIFFGMGVSGVQFLVAEAARAASSADTRAGALTTMTNKANTVLGTGIVRVFKIRAIGGVNGTGCTLFVRKSPVGGGNGQTFNLSAPVPPADRPSSGNNEDNFIYEYQVAGSYDVFPLLDMSKVPLIGDIPGVCGGSRINYTATGAVENPRALDN